MPDVIAFGEVMVRLAPPHFQRLEQARTLDVEIGGAELNTAAGLARLGRSAAWVSRLPDNPLGRLVANRVRETGVSDQFVQYDRRRPLRAVLPRVRRVAAGEFDPLRPQGLGDRAGAARDVRLADDLRRGEVVPRHRHHGGAQPRVRPRRWTRRCAARRAPGVQVEHRPELPREALDAANGPRQVMGSLLPLCDVLIASEADAEHLFGITGERLHRSGGGAGRAVRRQDGGRHAPRGRSGVEEPLRGGRLLRRARRIESAWYEVEIVDRLGAGDALAAGLIHGLLDGDLKKGLDYGAALGALKHTIPGDLPWITKDEVEAVLQGHGLRVRR